MLNIFDLMGAGPGAAGLDAMARQFGLTQDQAQRAFAALMPAFALGLQRNPVTPSAFSGPAQGQEALGQLFGPPELTRQVAEQAAHWSGVSAQVLQQMMPIFAAALVASLSKFSEVMRAQASGNAAPGPGAAAAQPFEAWAEMMRGLMSGTGPASPGAQPAPAPSGSAPAEGANPFAEMLRTMAGQVPGEAAAPGPEAKAPPESEPPASAPQGEEMQAAWSKAMASGRQAQAQYIATLQNIFDQFWGAPPNRP